MIVKSTEMMSKLKWSTRDERNVNLQGVAEALLPKWFEVATLIAEDVFVADEPLLATFWVCIWFKREFFRLLSCSSFSIHSFFMPTYKDEFINENNFFMNRKSWCRAFNEAIYSNLVGSILFHTQKKKVSAQLSYLTHNSINPRGISKKLSINLKKNLAKCREIENFTSQYRKKRRVPVVFDTQFVRILAETWKNGQEWTVENGQKWTGGSICDYATFIHLVS